MDDYRVDPFVRIVLAVWRRNELGVDPSEVLEGLNGEERFLVCKAAEVLAHFGTNVPEPEILAPISGVIG